MIMCYDHVDQGRMASRGPRFLEGPEDRTETCDPLTSNGMQGG